MLRWRGSSVEWSTQEGGSGLSSKPIFFQNSNLKLLQVNQFGIQPNETSSQLFVLEFVWVVPDSSQGV